MLNRIWSIACCFLILGCLTAHAELPEEIRVISYNIHHGEGVDGKIDLERIAKLLSAEKPDLVALNEVDQGTNRTHKLDMPAELARLTGMQAVFEKNIDHDGGLYGNAILSRLPIRRHENHKLPSHYTGEQRGVLEVELGDEDEKEPLYFFASHFDYRPDDGERLDSVKELEELIVPRKDQLMILAGDLNAVPDTEVIRGMQKSWKMTNAEPILTFPAANPDKQIDYILVRPADRWEVKEVRVLDEAVASDHRPVLAILRRVAK